MRSPTFALLAFTIACGAHDDGLGPRPPAEWDFDGLYEGAFVLTYFDSTYDCPDNPEYVCGGQTLVRYECPTLAEVTEVGDSTLTGVLMHDLDECAVQSRYPPDDTTDYVTIADTIPFEAFITFSEVQYIEGYYHTNGYWSYHAHGDLVWGTGKPDDFERLLGCVPLGDPIGVFYGGDPASSPPYYNPGMDSKVAGRTAYNSGKDVRCDGRRMHLLLWFQLYRPE